LKNRTHRAFTLLELTVVIVVLGILATLAVPSFASVISTSSQQIANADAAAFGRDVQANLMLNIDSADTYTVDMAGNTVAGEDTKLGYVGAAQTNSPWTTPGTTAYLLLEDQVNGTTLYCYVNNLLPGQVVTSSCN